MHSIDEAALEASVEIPADILDLVTAHGIHERPRSVIAVRLRAYWGRIAELAEGRLDEADRWLDAYNWAIEQEDKLRQAPLALK